MGRSRICVGWAGYNGCRVISVTQMDPLKLLDGGYLFKSNSKSSLVQTISKFLKDTEKNNINKKKNLKKRLKKFTSFYHAKNLNNIILNLKK